MKKMLLIFMCVLSISVTAHKREEPIIPIPSKPQLVWQDAELVAVFHYDLHVFDGVKYKQSRNRITPIADVNIFNPTQLNTDQWIKSAKAAGVKIAILTATHETGFALYQSDVNPYCMKAIKFQDGKGDIVRDFVNSCRKYGIKPGIYIGIRWNSHFGVYDFKVINDGTDFAKNRQNAYNRMCEGMTHELMSRYGDLAIVWYDGGGCGPEIGGPDILPIVEKYQKNIIFYHNSQRAGIRWGGSESGTVPYPCWGSYPFPYSHSVNQEVVYKDNYKLLKEGDPNGHYYMPAMSDVPLRGYGGRHEWFWEPEDDAHVFPLASLMKMYRHSVGRNSSLIIGLTPDERGLLPDVDVQRLKELGEEIHKEFGTPLKQVIAKTGKKIILKLDHPTLVNNIVIEEDIKQGERVRAYHIDVRTNGKWSTVVKGSCIGHKRIEEINPIKNVSAIRLIIDKYQDVPQIKRFSIY